MRKLVTTLLIISAALGVKAQQSGFSKQLPQQPFSPKQQPLQKFRFLPDSLAANNFSFKTFDGMSKFNAIPAKKLNVLASTTINNMPVARMQGNSKMPVKTDITVYNMPVLSGKPLVEYNLKKYSGTDNTLPGPLKK